MRRQLFNTGTVRLNRRNVLFLFFIMTVGVVNGFTEAPPRPPSVPRSAHYVDRIEDGTWFDCSVDTRRNVDLCKAWDDRGVLIADGAFRLEDEDRAATTAELHPSLVLSSGGKAYMIYLFGKQGVF